MVVDFGDKKENKCPRCGGRRTISTPDGKHNEICPICEGSGRGKIEPRKCEWKG